MTLYISQIQLIRIDTVKILSSGYGINRLSRTVNEDRNHVLAVETECIHRAPSPIEHFQHRICLPVLRQLLHIGAHIYGINIIPVGKKGNITQVYRRHIRIEIVFPRTGLITCRSYRNEPVVFIYIEYIYPAVLFVAYGSFTSVSGHMSIVPAYVGTFAERYGVFVKIVQDVFNRPVGHIYQFKRMRAVIVVSYERTDQKAAV